MSKQATGWAIRHWKGHIYVATVRETRAEAIAAFNEQFDAVYDRITNKAVRVTIIAEAEGGK